MMNEILKPQATGGFWEIHIHSDTSLRQFSIAKIWNKGNFYRDGAQYFCIKYNKFLLISHVAGNVNIHDPNGINVLGSGEKLEINPSTVTQIIVYGRDVLKEIREMIYVNVKEE